jgi:hypothetical protein
MSLRAKSNKDAGVVKIMAAATKEIQLHYAVKNTTHIACA